MLANYDEAIEAMTEMLDRGTIAELFINSEWEYMDVTVRCYYLTQAVDEVVEEDE